MSDTAYLTLENGKGFKGKFFGARHDIIGEVVFTTGMTGYLETLTDKSYYGQIIVQTFPLVGNYGVIPADFEAPFIGCAAYIVKSWCEEPSNFRSEGNLDTFLKAQNIVGLYGIDTRTLTKIIRETGVMNGMITADPAAADLDKIRAYKITSAVPAMSGKEIERHNAPGGKYRVALLDFGQKENIQRELVKRGCDVISLPSHSTDSEILEAAPDGIMLSNGPGDPADNPEIISTLKELIRHGIPMFGICLGHQLLALSSGFKTEKLKYGHRGANHPVKDLASGRVYITSQNHGYAVVSESVDAAVARESFININDNTNEGLEYINAPLLSAQFHPEACGGARDTTFLFDRFMTMMEVYKNAAR